jgi:protein SCO1
MDMNTRRALVAGLGVATLGGLVGRRAAAEPVRARHGGTRAAALPNVPLVTHEGQAVTFYDDLIRGKVVAINMMYAECEGICPLATSNLVRVQELLGERVGRDVFLYSLTLQPELDTPQRLQEYVGMHGVKPGWLFLTGARADIERLRYRLGFFDPNPVVDGDKATHTGMVRIGNDGYDRWTSASSLALPEQIVATINHVDRSRRHRGGSYKG